MRGHWITRYSYPGGVPFRVWRRSVPRIPADIIDSIIYLYPSRQEAEDGECVGGSGFLVVVPSGDVTQLAGYLDGYLPGDLYAVTNQHVVFGDSNSTVIRLNTQAGALEIMETNAQDWVRHPDGDDVAVCPLELDPATLRFAAIPTYVFAPTSYPENNAFDLGSGDEVVFVGRFVTHDGKQTNRPTVRFGNISMYPEEPIHDERRGITQDSFLVEARSLPGYSGSPVFVYNIAGGFMTSYTGPAGERPRQSLIGLDWCHLRNAQSVLEPDRKTETGDIIWENTGLMGVVPAWKIQEVLEMEELRMVREEKKKKRSDGLDTPPDEVALDSADKEPHTIKRGAFEEALRKVTRRVDDPAKD